jgi:hypothetical protein
MPLPWKIDHENQFSGEVWKNKAGKRTAVQFSGEVWKNKAGKHTAVQFSG